MEVNAITFGGQCVRSPIPRPYGDKGKILCNLVLVNRSGKNPIFVECIAFDTEADLIASYIEKGDEIIVEGKLAQETWIEQDTNKKRERIKIAVRKSYSKKYPPVIS